MIKVIADKNCTGKTRRLIEDSLATGNPILALTPIKAASLKEKSIAYFGKEVTTIDLEELKSYSGSIYIDDLDEVLTSFLQVLTHNDNIEVSGIVVNT